MSVIDPSLDTRILNAAVAALNAGRPAEVPEVTKRRRLPDDIIDVARMAVFLGDGQTDPPRGSSNRDPLTRRRMQFAVQCVSPTDDVDLLDSICDPMTNWAVEVLGSTNLSNLVHYVREVSTQRIPEYRDVYVITVLKVFEASYQTRRTDQTLSA